MLSDIRLTLRWLSRSPGVATVAVGTLAGAIAGGVVTFAVVPLTSVTTGSLLFVASVSALALPAWRAACTEPSVSRRRQ